MARRVSNTSHLIVLTVVGLGVSSAAADPVLFSSQYADAAGEGFNDPVLGPSRKIAFEYALNLIGSVFSRQYVGETVVVSAQFNPLGGTGTSAVLGQGGPQTYFSSPSLPVPSAFYPAALTNDRFHSDVNGADQEINITFNTVVDNATVLGNVDWYYGTDSNAGSNVDLVTVTMHELGHGLGFGGFLQSNGAYNSSIVQRLNSHS